MLHHQYTLDNTFKTDRVLASCLPFGKYPLLNVEAITGVAVSTWVFSFFVSGLVTALYQSNYEPAVVLCIPDLPIGFFITLLRLLELVRLPVFWTH